MKFRTSLILVCMTVVPALALFSHRVPGEVRSVIRCRLWEPIESWVASLSRPRPRAAPKTMPAGDHHDPLTAPVSLATDARPPVAADGPVFEPSPAPTPRETLASLGAVAIDCRSLDGVSGTHVAACRVAVDDAGQLHRVFQAAGPTPDEALAALLEAVRGWRQRLAATGSSTAAEPLRF